MNTYIMKIFPGSKYITLLLILFVVLQIQNTAFAAKDKASLATKNNAINSIVAIVNDGVITSGELNKELEIIKAQLRQQQRQLPPDDVIKKQVLDRMVLVRLQLQMAERGLLTIDDESLTRAIANIAEQNGMELSQFRRALESGGMDYSEYRDRIKDEMLISRLQQRQVQRKISVTDQEISDFLANQELREGSDDEYRLQHILFVVPEAANANRIQEVKTKAENILAQLKNGEDFAQMAISHSDGQQALEGGDLGWRKLAETPSLFADLITKMKPGDISDIVRSPSGFHIIKLAEMRSSEAQHIVEQTRARHILLEVNELVSSEESKTRLLQLKQRIDGGEDFAQLAIAHSNDKGSAGDGGSLGWVNPGTMVKEFEDAMNKLQPGEISGPVRTRFGWHLIKVEERRKYDNTEQFMKNKARQFIQQQKLGPALNNWLRQIRDEAFVELRL